MEEKIIKIMQLVQIKKDNTVEFPEEAKKLIHEAAEKCRKLPVYKDNMTGTEKQCIQNRKKTLHQAKQKLA